ncbi:MAG: ABC transporter substrate-binding protein [Thermoleophilaceae bacterium]|nr:ABC transporter substrate-binding protein [Thermoleophilaceae bacterium]
MKAPQALEFRLLGPLEAWRGDERLELGAPKQRAVLALLLLHRGEVVPSDRLVDELWGAQPPQAAAKSLQVYVSGLRKALGEGVVETRGRAYVLVPGDSRTDSERFEHLLEEGRRSLSEGDAAGAARSLREALGLWRGPALSEFAYEDFAQEEIGRLEELRLATVEERIDADLALGRHADLVAELTGLVGEHPLRERMRSQLMLALYRSGRQAEALDAYQAGRRALLDERGLEPGPALRELETAILRQDPALGAPTKPGPALVGRRRRGGGLVVAGGAVLLAAAVAAVIAIDGGDGSGSDPLGDGIAALDRASGDVASFTDTEAVPGNVAAGEGAVWVLNTGGERTVSRIDPRTGELTGTFETGGLPAEIAAGEGAVWVGLVGGSGDTNSLVGVARLDPRSGRVTATARLPGGGKGVLPTAGLPRVAAGAGAVWAINPDGSISRIDRDTGEIEARIELREAAWTLAAGREGVWFLSFGDTVTRIDPRTNRVGQTVRVGTQGLWGLAVGDGSVWATARDDGLLWRIEPGRNPVSRTIDVGTGVTAVASGGGAVWTGNYIDGTVSRIDPRTNDVTRRTSIGAPQALAAGPGGAWVSVAGRTTEGPLRASVCGEVASGGARPDVLIASDFPLQGPNSGDPRALAGAIRYVLERRRFRAGDHVVGYQSCDVSTVETGGFEFRRCAANANAYAHATELVAVIGTYSSFCAEVEIPILNRAPGGPLGMISPSNTGSGLTRGGPLALKRGEPGVYYPTGVRNFVRVAPREDVQAAALALHARRIGLERVNVLQEPRSDWRAEHADPFRRAAERLGLDVVGPELFDPAAESYAALADAVARSGAQAVFVAGTAWDGGAGLVKALRARSDRLRIMLMEPFASVPELIEMLGPAARGIYIGAADVPPAARELSPAGESFARGFGALDDPAQFALAAAQAAEVVMRAIARSDGSRESVLENLRAARVRDGLLGTFRFDRGGDIAPATVAVYRVADRAAPVPGGYPWFEGAVVDDVLTVPASLTDSSNKG